MEYFILIFIIIIVDQFSKHCAVLHIEKISALSFLDGIVKFKLVKNCGAAFGILKARQKLLKVIIILIILMISVYLIILMKSGGNNLLKIALVFIIGGAVGNYIDRIRFNYVIDFIIFSFRRCPVFNIADVFIFIGSVIIFYLFLID